MALNNFVVTKSKRKYQRRKGPRNQQIFEANSSQSDTKKRKHSPNVVSSNTRIVFDEVTTVIISFKGVVVPIVTYS